MCYRILVLYVLYVSLCNVYVVLSQFGPHKYSLTCGQECVSVFSLVNVVKRGLIISNVIHSVTSHYIHIPTPISVSLMSFLPFFPSLSFLFHLLSLLCHPPLSIRFLHHIKKKTQSAEKETQEVAISVPPSMPPAFPSFSFHHISFFISADSGHSRLVFISRALSKQKKSNLRFISKCHLISIESPPPVGSTVEPK